MIDIKNVSHKKISGKNIIKIMALTTFILFISLCDMFTSSNIMFNNYVGNFTLTPEYSLSFNLLLNNYEYYTKFDNNPILIVKHVNSSNGYFNSDIKSTYLENENNINSNTYMIVGNLNKTDYLRENLYYKFKIIWHLIDGTQSSIIFTQQTWLTDNITNIDRLGVAINYNESNNYNGTSFNGIGNIMDIIEPYNDNKIKGFDNIEAWGVEIYLYKGFNEDIFNKVWLCVQAFNIKCILYLYITIGIDNGT